MIPHMKPSFTILCLAAATCCWAEDNALTKPGFFTHENPGIQIAVSTENAEAQRLVNLGLKEYLYGSNERAGNFFEDALREDAHCLLAHIGMMMIHPMRSEIYRNHLQQLNTGLEEAVLTPVEEWYVATFIQYLNGDLPGAAQAFRERAATYRRDSMAACWDIVLNHYAGEKNETLIPRADTLVNRLPDSPLAHFCRALIEENNSPSDTARKAARSASRLTEKSPHPGIELLAGRLESRAGEWKQALKHFETAAKCAPNQSESFYTARLSIPAAWIQSGDKKLWMEALKYAKKLSDEAPGNTPETDAELLNYWEGKTLLLRMLVLQKTPPGGPAINMASRSCNAPEGHPLKLVQDCLVAAIQARSLAETGRITTATTTFTKAEKLLSQLQREGELSIPASGMSRTCYQRAFRACSGALYRAKVALYKESASIWQPYLDDILNTPEPRLLPPVLPH